MNVAEEVINLVSGLEPNGSSRWLHGIPAAIAVSQGTWEAIRSQCEVVPVNSDTSTINVLSGIEIVVDESAAREAIVLDAHQLTWWRRTGRIVPATVAKMYMKGRP